MSAPIHQGAAQPAYHALQDRLDVTAETPKACKGLEKFYAFNDSITYAHSTEFSIE